MAIGTNILTLRGKIYVAQVVLHVLLVLIFKLTTVK